MNSNLLSVKVILTNGDGHNYLKRSLTIVVIY